MSRIVLLVDDSEHDRDAYRRALRNSDILTATTVAEGLAMAITHRPDVVLLDYHMSDGNGLEFLRRLDASGADDPPPVIMLTGCGNETVAVEAIKAGADDYLIKDIEGRYCKLLPTVVERVVREHALRLEKCEAERQLQLAANVYHNITEGIVATTPEGTIVSVNPAYCRITGYASEELIGGNPRLLKSGRHGPDFYRALWDSIGQEGYWQGEIWNRRKNGDLFLASETITAIRDDHGRLQNYVAVLTDITEARQAEEFVWHQAYHDLLTGLPNRSLFMDRLRHQLAYAQRKQQGMAVLFIDLDGFKAVNDNLGHDFGDDVLKEVAVRLNDSVRESDTVARLGGDEFTAILNDINDPADATLVAQKILDQMGQPFLIRERELNISASIGIAIFPSAGVGAQVLLKAADEAMYQAKRAGRAAFAVAGGKD